MMKDKLWMAILPAVLVMFSGCRIVEGIFKAGFWSGIILVFAVIFLIVYLVARSRRR
jgi:hypothetical protein